MLLANELSLEGAHEISWELITFCFLILSLITWVCLVCKSLIMSTQICAHLFHGFFLGKIFLKTWLMSYDDVLQLCQTQMPTGTIQDIHINTQDGLASFE